VSQPVSSQPPLQDCYDLAVIGGGINGVGIAADAAGRGLKVFLCEKDDLAQHTSSASSKLIHGGLRYLEHYEFRLVREALAEREVLLAKAPHIVKPMRFVLPHRPHLRPAWMIRAGLFLYDHLGKRKRLGASRSLRFGPGYPLKPTITRGFEYADCAVDDARLVVLNAMAAREHGADILTRTRCLRAERVDGLWQVDLQHADGSLQTIRARALVNAAGPWVASFIKDDLKLDAPYGIRLIQGSHLIVPRLYEGDHAYILQNEDQRIVFCIPYLDRFTLIGTTDREYSGDGIVLYPHFTDRVIPGWFDKTLPWRKASVERLQDVLLLAPSKEYLARLPYGKLPDRNDFKRFMGDAPGRQKYWHAAMDESRRLGDEFLELTANGRLAERLLTL